MTYETTTLGTFEDEAEFRRALAEHIRGFRAEKAIIEEVNRERSETTEDAD
jgi:hypothetical protein